MKFILSTENMHVRLNQSSLPHSLTGEVVNITALTLTDSHYGNDHLIVDHLINQPKTGRPKFDFLAVLNPT